MLAAENPMAKKLRAGVIGCRAIAQHCHLMGYAAHPDVTLVGAAEGLNALRIALAGYESSKTGRKVVLGE